MPFPPAPRARITRIARGAVHDGPGIRTVVFFKGCPLRCGWCHSPETQSCSPELLFHEDRCIACESCAARCASGAISSIGGQMHHDRERCTACGSCTDVCPTLARELCGRAVTVRDVMRDVMSDRILYDESGGGLTLSGGEPLLQPAFALALLRAARRERIHTAIETCGLCNSRMLREAVPLTDLFLFDVKVVNDRRHRLATGASNQRIVANLRALAAARANVRIRFPLVAGLNDDQENVASIGALVTGLGLHDIDVLPYHRAGIAKYARTGRPYTLGHIVPPSATAVGLAVGTLERLGLRVTVGGLT